MYDCLCNQSHTTKEFWLSKQFAAPQLPGGGEVHALYDRGPIAHNVVPSIIINTYGIWMWVNYSMERQRGHRQGQRNGSLLIRLLLGQQYVKSVSLCPLPYFHSYSQRLYFVSLLSGNSFLLTQSSFLKKTAYCPFSTHNNDGVLFSSWIDSLSA